MSGHDGIVVTNRDLQGETKIHFKYRPSSILFFYLIDKSTAKLVKYDQAGINRSVYVHSENFHIMLQSGCLFPVKNRVYS